MAYLRCKIPVKNLDIDPTHAVVQNMNTAESLRSTNLILRIFWLPRAMAVVLEGLARFESVSFHVASALCFGDL